MSQCSNSPTTGAMITCDINAELPLSEDEYAEVSASETGNSKQSGNKPSTTPTGKPTTSAIPD
eukprot:8428015-Ditylum_brightwellii.AAC.1